MLLCERLFVRGGLSCPFLSQTGMSSLILSDKARGEAEVSAATITRKFIDDASPLTWRSRVFRKTLRNIVTLSKDLRIFYPQMHLMRRGQNDVLSFFLLNFTLITIKMISKSLALFGDKLSNSHTAGLRSCICILQISI